MQKIQLQNVQGDLTWNKWQWINIKQCKYIFIYIYIYIYIHMDFLWEALSFDTLPETNVAAWNAWLGRWFMCFRNGASRAGAILIFGMVITNHIGSMRLVYLPTFSWFLLGKLVPVHPHFLASYGYLWVIFIQKSLFQSMRIQPIQRWWFFVLGLPKRRNITNETPVVGTVVLLGSGVFFPRTCNLWRNL